MLFGPVERPENRSLIDLDLREKVVMVAILIPIVWIGVRPESALVKVRPAIIDLLHVMETRSAEAALPSPALVRQAAIGAARD